MNENITIGIELNVPSTVTLKLVKTMLKLLLRSGVTSLLARQMKTIARTIYRLRMALKKEENLKELRDLARDIGNTKKNYKFALWDSK